MYSIIVIYISSLFYTATEEDLKELHMIEQLTLLIAPRCKARAFQKFPVSMHVCMKYISFPILVRTCISDGVFTCRWHIHSWARVALYMLKLAL